MSIELKTAAKAHCDLVPEGHGVSYTTAIGALKELGFVARVKKKMPLLTEHHKENHLKWAKEH